MCILFMIMTVGAMLEMIKEQEFMDEIDKSCYKNVKQCMSTDLRFGTTLFSDKAFLRDFHCVQNVYQNSWMQDSRNEQETKLIKMVGLMLTFLLLNFLLMVIFLPQYVHSQIIFSQ